MQLLLRHPFDASASHQWWVMPSRISVGEGSYRVTGRMWVDPIWRYILIDRHYSSGTSSHELSVPTACHCRNVCSLHCVQMVIQRSLHRALTTRKPEGTHFERRMQKRIQRCTQRLKNDRVCGAITAWNIEGDCLRRAIITRKPEGACTWHSFKTCLEMHLEIRRRSPPRHDYRTEDRRRSYLDTKSEPHLI